MNSVRVGDIITYCFPSKDELINNISNNKEIYIAINAEKILKASDVVNNIINQHIGYADGIGAVWALHRKGYSKAVKIPGCELWLDVIANYYKEKSFYLIGAKEEVIQQTVNKLKKEYSQINILGYRNGYINSSNEKEKLIEDISKKQPDIVFVAMGSPKQEYLMEEMYSKHKASYLGLGGSFDVYVGNVERAPQWWIDNNLEWTYRLIKQPKRILRQYVYLEFLLKLLFNKL